MTDATPNPLYNLECAPNTGNYKDPDLLAGDNLDKLRGRNPYPAMSERFRLTELLETAKYQNNLLAQKCRELEKEAFHLAANQCHAGYGGEYGHHRCREIDRLTEERDEARRIACKNEAELNRTMFDNPMYADPAAIAAQRGWDCFDRPYRETTFNGDPPIE